MINLPTGVLKVEELVCPARYPARRHYLRRQRRNGEVFLAEQGSVFSRVQRRLSGRKVVNCHPPASAHIVTKIVEDFKSGKKKTTRDFWIEAGERYILIRYLPSENKEGEFLMRTGGNAGPKNPLQEITGRKAAAVRLK